MSEQAKASASKGELRVGDKINTISSISKHSNPKMQAHIDEARDLHEHLVGQFNKQVENLSAGGVKRILRSLVTFQDIKFKGDEFELFSLSEALLRGKVTIMLTAAADKSVTEAVKQKEEEQEAEEAANAAKEQEDGV